MADSRITSRSCSSRSALCNVEMTLRSQTERQVHSRLLNMDILEGKTWTPSAGSHGYSQPEDMDTLSQKIWTLSYRPYGHPQMEDMDILT